MTTPTGQRPRISLVINPVAGRGAAIPAGEVAARVLRSGAEVTVLRPDGGVAGSLAALAGARADRPDAVVVCGGDGIVHLAANVLAGGDVPLGVIPSGTGNDAADVLGVSHRPEVAARQALDALASGSVRRIDVGRCDGPALVPGTDRAFVGLLYAGFDSAVNDRANRLRWPRGAARYNVALAVETVRLRPRPFRLTLAGDGDGAPTELVAPATELAVPATELAVPATELAVPVTLVAVGNGAQYGGGKRIAPHARWDDGILGVTVIGPVSRLTLARLAPTLPRAGHIGHPRVRLYRAREVTLDAAGTVAYADGEPIGALPIRAWVQPAALPVLAPGSFV